MVSRNSKDPEFVIDSGTQVQAVQGQVSTDLGEEAVILHIASGRYYCLEGAGGLVWKLIEEPRTVGDLVDRVLEEYEVEREQCQEDIENLMRDLLEKQLVQVVEG